MKKLMFGILMAFGIVSVSVALPPRLVERIDDQIQYVKEVVAELEDLKKQGKLPYEAKEYLQQGKDFLEFAEKVKQETEEDCDRAVQNVMNDGDNRDKYHYYVWAESRSGFGCMSLQFFTEGVRKAKKGLRIYE